MAKNFINMSFKININKNNFLKRKNHLISLIRIMKSQLTKIYDVYNI